MSKIASISVLLPVLQQETPEGLQNASASMGFASSMELVPVIFLVAASALVIGIARPLVPWLAESKILGSIGDTITTSFAYALWGLATVLTVGVVAAPIYALATVDGGTRSMVLRWAGIALAGYIVLVGLGWGTKRVVAAYVDAHPDAETLDDLLPDSPDDSADVATDGGQE